MFILLFTFTIIFYFTIGGMEMGLEWIGVSVGWFITPRWWGVGLTRLVNQPQGGWKDLPRWWGEQMSY